MWLLLWLSLCVGAALIMACVAAYNLFIKDRVKINRIDRINKGLEDTIEMPMSIEEELKRRKQC